MDSDKRACPRFIFSESVAYAQQDLIANGGVAGNISISGMSLRVQEFVPIGVMVELQIRLGQTSKVIWVKGIVVRVREVLADDCYEIGLKFVYDEECIKAIGEYIDTCRFKKERENHG